MADKKYRARPGSPFTDAMASKYGKVLEQIENQHGHVTKELVLQHAQNPQSPLHSYFEWDDDKAAIKHREHQAAQIICGIVWKVQMQDEPLYIRSWNMVNVKTNQGKKNVYINNYDVMNNEDLLAQTVDKIFKSYLGWRRQYAYYKDWKEAKTKIVKYETKGAKKKSKS